MSDLCQVCIEHDCASHMDGVTQCEGFKPPWRDIPCDLCHTPTNPFHLQRVKRGERTLLVCDGCVGDAVNHWIDVVREAAQEAKSG